MKGPNRKTKQKKKTEYASEKMTVSRTPPQVRDQLAASITLRFITTANFLGQLSVTYQNLLDAWFIVGSATTAYQLFDFVRLRRVTVRALCSAAQVAGNGVAATVGIEMPDLSLGISGSGRQASASNFGTAFPAVCTLTPARDSMTGKWQSSQAQTAFVVRASDYAQTRIVGAIIDVEVSYKNSADVNPSAIQNGVTGLGLNNGELYFGGLDGARLAGTQAYSAFQPRG